MCRQDSVELCIQDSVELCIQDSVELLYIQLSICVITHLYGVQPFPDVDERPLVCTVVQQKHTIRTPEVGLSNRSEPVHTPLHVLYTACTARPSVHYTTYH